MSIIMFVIHVVALLVAWPLLLFTIPIHLLIVATLGK